MVDKNRTINPGGLSGPITRKTGDSTTGTQVRPLPGSLKTPGGLPDAAQAGTTGMDSLSPILSPLQAVNQNRKREIISIPGVNVGTPASTSYSEKQGKGPTPNAPKEAGIGFAGKSLLSRNTQTSVIQYLRNLVSNQTSRIELRQAFEVIDREIARTNNVDEDKLNAKARNALGDKGKNVIQDITVPVVQPQTQAAFAYMVGVFLTGNPIFEMEAGPEMEDAAVQFNTVIQDQQTKMGWVRHLAMSLLDGLKYNLMAVEIDWHKIQTYNLANDATSTVGLAKKTQTLWQGNKVRRIDLYNAFWDTRVAPADVHTNGEFAGYTEIMSKIALKKKLAELDNGMNFKEAFESFRGGVGGDIYYVPQVTDKLNMDPRQNEYNWSNWFAGNPQKPSKINYNYKGVYELTTLYARILPAEFGMNVPAPNTVQIWKFLIVNGQVVVHAERQTNVHDYLPIIFGQPLEDGLQYQTLSFSEQVVDIQDMASQIWNIKIASSRRNVSDRMVYDPTKVKPEDINSQNPNAKIPIRPNSYGTDIRNAIYQIPFEDRSSQSLIPDALRVVDLGRTITGINAPQEGTFIKGNRTMEEFNTVSANANARLQTMAQLIEAQFFVPVKEIIKMNILQYQQAQSYYDPNSQGTVDVNPVQLRDAVMAFKMADGLLPIDKLVDTQFLTTLLQSILSSPILAQEWDPVALLAYLGKLKNIQGLDKFRRVQNATAPQGTPAGGTQPGTGSGNNPNVQNATIPPIPG